MKKKWTIMIILSLLSLTVGCAGQTRLKSLVCPGPSRLELDYGTSFNLAKFNQVAHPEAERNLEPVIGLDGQAAKASLDKYRKSFEMPGTPPALMLSIGTESNR